MAEVLEWLRGWIEALILGLGYPGIVLVMFAENLFPPIPSELVMPFAGFLAARGELDFAGVLIAGTAGSALGALALYGLGLWIGERALRAFVARWGRGWLMSVDDLDRALRVFRRFGYAAVLIGRLMPIVRSLISIPAGLNRMNLRLFLLLTCAGAGAWNLVMGGAGLLLGARWEELLDFAKQYERVLMAALAVGLALAAWRLTRGERARRWRPRAAEDA